MTDRPTPEPIRGNWTDRRCYYVTVRDARRTGFLAGPFAHQRQAAAAVERTKEAAYEVDGYAWFYAYGTAKAPNGHREGTLNDLVDLDRLPHRPREYVARPDGYDY